MKGKNLRTLGGMPLVAWAVRNALHAARSLEDPGLGPHAVVCSTDSGEIAGVARDWGADTPFLRPEPLARDTATAEDVALHALEWLAERGRSFRAVAKIQPTSPLALPADIAAAVRLFLESGQPVASVSPARPPSWTFDVARGRLDEVVADPPGVTRRQDYPPYAAVNGAVCVSSPARLRASRSFTEAGVTLASLMPAERGIDVDTEQDLLVCAGLLAARAVNSVALAGRRLGDPGPGVLVADAGETAIDAASAVDAAAQAGADLLLLPAATLRETGLRERAAARGLGLCARAGALSEAAGAAVPVFLRADGSALHEVAQAAEALAAGSGGVVLETSSLRRITELRQGMSRPVAARVDECATAAAAAAAGADAVVASLGPSFADVAGCLRAAERALGRGA